jgi:hypothetical protein
MMYVGGTLMKRVLFLFSIVMLLLTPVLGCADASSNEAKIEKPVSSKMIITFAPVSPTYETGQAPQFNYEVSSNTKSIQFIGPNGDVFIEAPVEAGGNAVLKPKEPSLKGVYPANFKGAAFGQPAKMVGDIQILKYTMVATRDGAQDSTSTSIKIIKPLESTK